MSKERKVSIQTYITVEQEEFLNKKSEELRIPKTIMIREAIEDLMDKYDFAAIEEVPE